MWHARAAAAAAQGRIQDLLRGGGHRGGHYTAKLLSVIFVITSLAIHTQSFIHQILVAHMK